MGREPTLIQKSYSWPKTVVRKWLNLKTSEICSERSTEKNGDVQRRKSCSDKDSSVLRRRDLPGGWLAEGRDNLEPPRVPSYSPTGSSPPIDNLRMVVGTWNVGGRPPHCGLNLRDWLMSTPSSPDIYVLGFQEIVPLNAGNVLGPEDKGPACKWLSLIRQVLNPPGIHGDASESDSPSAQKPRVSFSDLLSMELELEEPEDELASMNPSSSSGGDSPDLYLGSITPHRGGYCLAASKQMVGIFLCVWVRASIMHRISALEISCVGRGIMGCMGNKGSISISMTLERTTFCFICTHLASGEKDGDEVRRNLDVAEIMKRTRFQQSHRIAGPAPYLPETILEHDKIIWLGDLNYRLASTNSDTHQLLQRNDWETLLQKDQLLIEQRAGRVFAGWDEGKIYFPPTYKYLANSDIYAVDQAKSREKRRTPAWCDRILWRGKGMKQMSYVRGESRFSDHRPVYSLFSVLMNDGLFDHGGVMTAEEHKAADVDSKSSSPLSSSSRGKVQAEELFLAATAPKPHGSRRVPNL
ncbi:type I inositol polyphosphate 5-phosphatase 8-like isoform X3 [Musa acuminata AAA Group]|uniref:type I inositol polyphosphate 5-phosphatase 8-like isoform X3 n=1 Tax=Musa acuminata AAA Group TaxID=214697 RepID=UPI0031D603FF